MHYPDDEWPEIRAAVGALCARFEPAYFRRVDAEESYPSEFVEALIEGGWLAAMIPSEYGGAGLGLGAASVILEEINRRGANAGAVHGQMYNMGTVLRSGSEAQKRRWLPAIAAGELRMQAMAVTEPGAGTDTTRTATRARREGDHYLISGQKVWTSRVLQSDLMVLLARTTPREQCTRRTAGMTVLVVDLREAIGRGLSVQPIANMVNHQTNSLYFDELAVPVANRIGAEGEGFSIILDGLNAERTLIAAECVGDARWFLERACAYAGEREVFDRPIGQNQGVQFPLAEAYMALRAADLMRWRAAALFDADERCGAEANMAKHLAARASWQAGEACLQTHGGYGFAREYDVERKFRETRLYQVAPVSSNLIFSYVAEHLLGLPRSY